MRSIFRHRLVHATLAVLATVSTVGCNTDTFRDSITLNLETSLITIVNELASQFVYNYIGASQGGLF